MKTLTIQTAKEMKLFISENRAIVTNINEVEFGETYPIIEATNRNVSYYDIETQGNKFLNPPFRVATK